ncbi:MAG: hypothetical protein PGN13_08380 [Patulibacter minatonensis]
MSPDSTPAGAVRIEAASRARPALGPTALEPLPRRSFLTGRVLDPELHPTLRHRLARAMRREHDRL